MISSKQLRALGFNAERIRTARGRWLHPIYHGVYSVGTRRVTHRGRVWAALLAYGDGAAASHRSAGALHGFVRQFPMEPEVTIPTAKRRQRGITLYRRELPADDVTESGGIVLVTAARALLDIAATRPRDELERALNEAHYLSLFTPWQIPEVIAAHKGWKGTSVLRAIYEDGGFGVTREELERIFGKLLRAHRLPLPETNVPVRLGNRIIHPDCVWRDAKLIVELDGGAAHRTASRFHGDRKRDRKLDIDGWTVWRVTWHDLRFEPDDLIADLRARLGC